MAKIEQRPIVVREHHMKLQTDPLRLKIIAEALGEYIGKHDQLADDTTIRDFAFNMEAEYQRWYALDEDDWGYTEEHKEELGIHEATTKNHAR
jgi:hypothetical protein